MDRRRLLVTAGIGISGLAGCFENTNAASNSLRIGLGRIIVDAHPETDLTDPIDVEVTVEKGGSEVYERTHEILDLSQDDGFSIQEEWMGSKVPYTVTIGTSIHDEPTSFSTAEYDEQVDEYWLQDQDCVSLQFRIFSWQIRPSPVPATCPESK